MTSVPEPDLRAELLRRRDREQQARRAYDDARDRGEEPDWAPVRAADEDNLVFLIEVIGRHGWLGSDLVGADGASACWLMVQHAPPEYQDAWLPLMEQAVREGLADPGELAFLQDRVTMHHGRPQTHGSQRWSTLDRREVRLWPVTDPATLNTRRAEVGLPPLDDETIASAWTPDQLREHGYQFAPLADRISAAMTGYACGDALGLPWEGLPPSGAGPAQIEALPARKGWERGATSDDTALTVLVAQHLAERGGAADAPVFLQTLAAQAGSIPGLGPSTTRAIEHFRATGAPPTSGGATNGAPMRALPIGWATPLDDPDRRRCRAIELTRATHPDPDALVAACVVAACASWAVEGASGQLLLTVAMDEAAQARSACGAGDRLGVMLASLRAGTWQPPPHGISLDPAETVTAALACTLGAASLRDGLIQAVGMGGDTDTVAAITGGLLGARMTVPEVLAELPWHAAVQLPDPALVAGISSALVAVRSSAS